MVFMRSRGTDNGSVSKSDQVTHFPGDLNDSLFFNSMLLSSSRAYISKKRKTYMQESDQVTHFPGDLDIITHLFFNSMLLSISRCYMVFQWTI